jgi:23S rRNA (adenine-N6)-dimethyltransferase
VSEQHAQHARGGSRRAPGRHLLSGQFVRELVDDACVDEGDLVVDIGAGTGHITAHLRRRGARVLAVELDAAFAGALRRRFAADAGVTVVEGDARTAPLPAEPFRVVANLPFAGSGAIVDRLLDATLPMHRADVVLEWAMAQKRAEVWPTTSRAVIAAASFSVTIARRLPAACFDPPPRVDAAVLVAERRSSPLVAAEDVKAFERFVRAGFAAPRLAVGLAGDVSPRRLRRLADQLAFPRDAAGRQLDHRQWVSLFREVQRAEGQRHVG